MPLKRCFVLVLILVPAAVSCQVREIDPAKLPADPLIHAAYDDLLHLDGYARTYETGWRFPIPRPDVTKRLTADLKVLEAAQKSHPENAELEIFTGLTAHLAYNLDDEEAYEPAMKLLGSLASTDFRAAWFLGIHQCQSNNTVGGMQQLLRVEASEKTLPGDFWQDYANCAGVTLMPVHAVRAYDLADEANAGKPVDAALEGLARNRIKPSTDTATYTDRQAWSEVETGSQVRFTSTLCGVSFEVPAEDGIRIGNIEKGICFAGAEAKLYPTRTHPSQATFAITSNPGEQGATLASFVRTFLNQPDFASARPVSGLPCPADSCLAYEVITDKIHGLQGGAHILALFFASEPPPYPGLKLETPIALPKADPQSTGPAFYRPNETLQRLPGTRFFVIIMDSNADIYKPSRADFEAFLRTVVIDSK